MKRIGNRKQPNWEWGEESKKRRWDFFDYLKKLPNLKKIEEGKKRKKEIIILLLLWLLFTLITLFQFYIGLHEIDSINSIPHYAVLAPISTVSLLLFIHGICWRFSLSFKFVKSRFTKQLLIISIISIVLVSYAMGNSYLDYYNIKLIDLLPSFF